MYGSLKKCAFFRPEIHYLGHIITGDGILVDPSKIRAIMEWPTPTNVTEVRSFMGLASYYRRFVAGFSRLAHPITSLQRKGHKFQWIEQCERAFQELKRALTSAPILAVPDPSRDFFVCTDASLDGIGAVLMQDGRAIAYESRKLKNHELNYPTHELELALVVHALVKWQHFLLGHHFELHSDHQSLQYIFSQPNLNARQRRWMEFLCEYDFDVHYIKGKENVVADALSRRRHMISSMTTTIDLKERILRHLPEDKLYAELCQLAQFQKPLVGKFVDYSLDPNGLLYHRGCIYVPSIGDLREFIILEAHRAPYVAHLGVKKLHSDLRQLYFWPRMRVQIVDIISRCLECQRVKAEHRHPGGLLQPHEIPMWKWDVISMDFIVGLPMSSHRHDAILVTVDTLTKVAHFSPIRTTFTTPAVVQVFL